MADNRILITGASGFAGSHLIEYLLSENAQELHGTVYGSQASDQLNHSNLHLHDLNLLDTHATHALVDEIKPTHVYHLAALSSPAASLSAPTETMTNNISAQVNLLEAVRVSSPKARILIVGSADEYGMVTSGSDTSAIDEQQSMNPVTPYAVSKIAQDYLGLQYYLTHKLDIIRVRPFNHTGERQVNAFVVPSFAEQIAAIEANRQEPTINVGNLESIRDFTDVQDMVRAYVLALELGNPGDVYNLGSGQEISIREILNLLLDLSTVEIQVKQDESKVRIADETRLVCNPRKFIKLTGWQPRIPIHVTLERVLHYWRNSYKSATNNQ
jgi:GDP-4-dehydro-6-deoxy-D-mannose reductase